jgi:hypothetical protein
MGRNNGVTAVVIFEAIAWLVLGFAILIGITTWLG